MNMSERYPEQGKHLKSIAFLFALILVISLNFPVNIRASAHGDALILLDQSRSMQLNNPGFSIEPWLVDFDKIFPGAKNVSLVGFDEKVHPPIIFSREDVASPELLQAKLEVVKLDGRVTDFERPLHYLLNYQGDIARAIIVTDGEPDIWSERLEFLSKEVLSDGRYVALNDRYKTMALRGLNQETRYRKLASLYNQRNFALIEKRLVEVKKKFGSQLVFVDVYGRSNYLQRWSDVASARLIVAQSPGEVIDALSEQKSTPLPKQATRPETVELANKPMDNTPVEEFPIKAEQSESQAEVTVQPVKVVSPPPPLTVQPVKVVSPPPPLTVTLEKTKEVPPEVVPPTVSKSAAWGIYLAVGMTVLVMAFLWIARELSLKRKKADRKRAVELELNGLQAKIVEAKSVISRLKNEKSGYELELTDLKKSIEDTVEKYRRMKFTEVDSEVAEKVTELEGLLQEKKLAIEQECESFKMEKLAAKEAEILAEKLIQEQKLTAELKNEEDMYAQKIQARKEQALEELTNWKLAETAKQQEALVAQLAKVEAESLEKIEKWEQDAASRVQGLLDSQYLDLKETYKNDLRNLAQERTAAEKRLESLNREIASLQEDLEMRRHQIRQEIDAQERRLQAILQDREALLWQETVAESKKAKEEALARIRQWEREEKERLRAILQA